MLCVGARAVGLRCYRMQVKSLQWILGNRVCQQRSASNFYQSHTRLPTSTGPSLTKATLELRCSVKTFVTEKRFCNLPFHLQAACFSTGKLLTAPKNDSEDAYLKGNINEELDDEFLHDQKYAELFMETYLLPVDGHRVFAIQPNLKSVPKAAQMTTVDLKLAELCALVETLPKWSVIEKEIYSLKVLDKKFVFGKGNFQGIGEKIRKLPGVTAVTLGLNMLNSTQLAQLQNSWGVAVYDRYTLVLQIFKTRAKTKEAKLQLALAEIPYYRSRLHGMHSGTLDRQKGGMKFVGGSGETFLEIRHRLLQEREQKLRKELAKLRSQRDLLRANRKRNEFPVVAVVGYTNAGKTSLIKALTGDQSMEPRDQLFATLDVTVHAGNLPNRMKVMFVDTVGFISDIPTTLVESFSATLEDIVNADLLIHIRDIAHPDTSAQKANVIQTLRSLQPPPFLLENMIEVCNKADLLDSRLLSDLKLEEDGSLALSVKEGFGLSELQNRIQDFLCKSTGRIKKHFRIPANGQHLAWLYKEATVENTRSDENDPEKLLVDVIMTEAALAKFMARFGRKNSTGSVAPSYD